jgi:hypothetical protein
VWHPLSAKVGITSPTSGGRSVGIVRSRTQTMELLYFSIWYSKRCCWWKSVLLCWTKGIGPLGIRSYTLWEGRLKLVGSIADSSALNNLKCGIKIEVRMIPSPVIILRPQWSCLIGQRNIISSSANDLIQKFAVHVAWAQFMSYEGSLLQSCVFTWKQQQHQNLP